MTYDEMIEVIEAVKDGKTIEFFYLGQWHICNKPTFNFDDTKYRVKPEPMVLYAIVNKSGEVLFVDEKREGLEVSVMKGNRIVKFIEAVE